MQSNLTGFFVKVWPVLLIGGAATGFFAAQGTGAFDAPVAQVDLSAPIDAETQADIDVTRAANALPALPAADQLAAAVSESLASAPVAEPDPLEAIVEAAVIAPEVAESPVPEEDHDHDVAEAGTDDHDMMMDMPAPDPNLVACVAELQTVAGRTRIYFDSNSSRVDARAREAAYYLASLVSACPEAQVTIAGFSDPLGDPGANLALSWRRANATMDILREGGFDLSRFTVHSHLQDHPDYCIHYDVVDRRVEFMVTQAD